MSFENEKRKIHQIINQLSYSCFTHGVFVWSCWLRSWKKKPNAETGNERDVKRTTWERVWACMPLKVFWLWFCTELSEPELCVHFGSVLPSSAQPSNLRGPSKRSLVLQLDDTGWSHFVCFGTRIFVSGTAVMCQGLCSHSRAFLPLLYERDKAIKTKVSSV